MKTLGLDGQVTQRLKRMQTILDKLGREHTLTLDRMQDIGGCRAVLPTRSAVYKLAEHIKTVKPTSRVVDYIAEPRRSGYRGIHIIVEYGDPVRPVEIQLRTVLMHAWATTVEDISGTGGVNYKMDGTSPMQVFLECYSRVLECRDLGEKPSKLLMKEYERLFSTAFEE
jgi:ppGpp synthetase/RelA/SpoT-type nucleotidyltranferase